MTLADALAKKLGHLAEEAKAKRHANPLAPHLTETYRQLNHHHSKENTQ